MSEVTSDNKEVKDNVIPLFPEVEDATHPDGIEMLEWTFTNDKTNPVIRQLFHLLYNGVFQNKLGLAHCRVKGTDQIHTVIVGVETDSEGNIQLLPLGKVLGDDELSMYEAPDGRGGYIES